MKKILFVSLFLSLGAFSAPSTSNKIVELGLYNAVDVKTGKINAQLLIEADGKITFNVKTPDFQMPQPGCVGKYTIVGEFFKSDLACPLLILPEVSVNIDITNVNSESVRSFEGALVPVVIDALSSEPEIFRLKIVL